MGAMIGFICGLILGAFTGLAVGAVLALDRDQERRDMENSERYKQEHDRIYQLRKAKERNQES